MRLDIEMSCVKVRYQTHKEERYRNIEELNELEDIEVINKKRKVLSTEELEELDEMEKLDAECRRVYDPLEKTFNHGNKRVTDLDENKKVNLPNPCDQHTESSIEIIKNSIMKTFKAYRDRE